MERREEVEVERDSPKRAPIAKLAFSSSSWFTAAKALKMSGAPLPRASSVTPATF